MSSSRLQFPISFTVVVDPITGRSMCQKKKKKQKFPVLANSKDYFLHLIRQTSTKLAGNLQDFLNLGALLILSV